MSSSTSDHGGLAGRVGEVDAPGDGPGRELERRHQYRRCACARARCSAVSRRVSSSAATSGTPRSQKASADSSARSGAVGQTITVVAAAVAGGAQRAVELVGRLRRARASQPMLRALAT